MRVRLGGIVVGIGSAKTVFLIFAFIVAVTWYLGTSVVHHDDTLLLATPIDFVLDRRDLYEGEEDDDDDLASRMRRRAGRTRRKKDARSRPVPMAMQSANVNKKYVLADALKGVIGKNRPPDVKYNINVTLSDRTSLDRSIPDTRPPACLNFTYDIDSLPAVSVIVPFFNEAPTMIIRTLHSVLNRSPDKLLEEIILVDDLSYDAPLKEPLDRYIRQLPKVRLIRRDKRSGLIVSRMDGARQAKAPVLLFLDAHSEVNDGWLEPVLDMLKRNPKQVVQPFIDGIDKNNLEYTTPETYFKGAFSWDLRYTWLQLSAYEEERAKRLGQPFFSPTLMGSAIAVMKDYFFEMGTFDEGMYVWGGENLELAFRVWMCGGQVVTATCSRVGHVFKQSPNKFDGTNGTKEQTVMKNLIRISDVWMDRYSKYFYATTLVYDFKRLRLDEEQRRSVAERRELRQKLKCHNFDWYLYNVIPEMMELPPMNSRFFGEIVNLHSKACWEVTEDYYVGMTYLCFEHKIIPQNNFVLTSDGLLRYRDKCVRVVAPKPYLVLSECPVDDLLESFGVWEMNARNVVWGGLKVKRRNSDNVVVYWCIVQVTNAMPEHHGEQMPQLGDCNVNDPFQTWAFTYAVDFSLEAKYVRP